MARKAAISFGLVHIPVKYENATEDNDIRFNQLHKHCKQRIKYNKSCPACGIDSVPAEDIVKGYEYEKDKFIIIDDEEFESIKTEKDKSIEILQFADISEIDPIYYYKSYYLYPDQSDKAFLLFKTAVAEEGKVAIGKTVLSTKENLVAIRVKEDTLILNLMFYQNDIRPASIQPTTADVNATELTMAKTLIQSLTKPFDPNIYKNEYQNRLKDLIQQKISGNEIITPTNINQSNVLNLMDALQASIQSLEDKKETNKKSPKKKKVTVE